MRVRMGYPEAAAEREILRSEAGAGVLQDMRPVLRALMSSDAGSREGHSRG